MDNINSRRLICFINDCEEHQNILEKNKGYDTIINNGWFDTYSLADYRDDGYTVTQKIDGWNDSENKRIDYIFTNRKIPVKSSEVIFNGENEKIISDHFGVIIEI